MLNRSLADGQLRPLAYDLRRGRGTIELFRKLLGILTAHREDDQIPRGERGPSVRAIKLVSELVRERRGEAILPCFSKQIGERRGGEAMVLIREQVELATSFWGEVLPRERSVEDLSDDDRTEERRRSAPELPHRQLHEDHFPLVHRLAEIHSRPSEPHDRIDRRREELVDLVQRRGDALQLLPPGESVVLQLPELACLGEREVGDQSRSELVVGQQPADLGQRVALVLDIV